MNQTKTEVFQLKNWLSEQIKLFYAARPSENQHSFKNVSVQAYFIDFFSRRFSALPLLLRKCKLIRVVTKHKRI